MLPFENLQRSVQLEVMSSSRVDEGGEGGYCLGASIKGCSWVKYRDSVPGGLAMISKGNTLVRYLRALIPT